MNITFIHPDFTDTYSVDAMQPSVFGMAVRLVLAAGGREPFPG